MESPFCTTQTSDFCEISIPHMPVPQYLLYQKKEFYEITVIYFDTSLDDFLTFCSQCYKCDDNMKNPDCPVCSRHLNALGKDLPYAHCSQSRLICAISGDSLNEYNPPLMLPNGHVYGSKVRSISKNMVGGILNGFG